MYKEYNCEQGSPEWIKIRLGKITGSAVKAILTEGKGITRDKFLYKLVAEWITRRRSDEEAKEFANVHTKRGKLWEEDARIVYQNRSGNKVRQVGFIELNPYVGYSPDGLVGKDGLIEIKCPDTPGYVDIVCMEKIDPEYLAQIQLGLYVTGREWCDFINYNKHYKKNMIFVKRLFKEDDFQKKLDIAIKKSIARIEELLIIFNEKFVK